ncbi:MAG: HAD family phosphatase [Halobacteriota archaeon]|nr:HAD family phosphatase [Halobacteriota archaeon]
MKLVAYDLEGVLVDRRSIWIDISKITGTFELNQKHRERYVRGKISYRRWSDIVVSSWNGFSVDIIEELIAGTPLMDGSEQTVKKINEMGHNQGIISNSITLLADRIGERLGMDREYISANVLGVDDGKLTGKMSVYHGWEDKVKTLRRYASRMRISMKDTVAVGDDINDMEMIKESGLGIAFNPKSDLLEEAADVVIKEKDLRAILPYIKD